MKYNKKLHKKDKNEEDNRKLKKDYDKLRKVYNNLVNDNKLKKESYNVKSRTPS